MVNEALAVCEAELPVGHQLMAQCLLLQVGPSLLDRVLIRISSLVRSVPPLLQVCACAPDL